MRAFDFDAAVLEDYAAFSRSFTAVRAEDLARQIGRHYDDGHFWPAPLLSLNPSYERGPSVVELAASGVLSADTANVFRSGGRTLTLHCHQAEAVAKAMSGQSFVVTTGTGSGKSLCFFIPIIDSILRARRNGEKARTRAIIVYPMNALANSQLGEIEKFVGQSDLPDLICPSVARYTGQESDAERTAIAVNPPDILLTNYMMLELLLTRQDTTDTKVIENCRGLEFIVLDELHTYRGRQGADVSLLVRRLRDRCCLADPICIGTSATMASEDAAAEPRKAVARVASRIFGTTIAADAVITESLRRATRDDLDAAWARTRLNGVLQEPIPPHLTDAALGEHPLAVWIELTLGLDEAKSRARRTPTALDEAIAALASEGGVTSDTAAERLSAFLALTALPEKERGGTGNDAFMAFKLHRFISGAGDVLTTLKPRPRTVLLEGQRRDPQDPEARLYPTRFCRGCGQEYHVVTLQATPGGRVALPRDIDETPSGAEPEDAEAGYLTPWLDGDDEFRFTGDVETFARDLGHDGPPFAWDEDRRAHLRADLDAFYARAYDLTRDELRYILDPAHVKGADYPSETFRVLKEKEIRHHGEYRTRRLVLEAWDRMEADGSFTAMEM